MQGFKNFQGSQGHISNSRLFQGHQGSLRTLMGRPENWRKNADVICAKQHKNVAATGIIMTIQVNM
jgi:hypothetical protein